MIAQVHYEQITVCFDGALLSWTVQPEYDIHSFSVKAAFGSEAYTTIISHCTDFGKIMNARIDMGDKKSIHVKIVLFDKHHRSKVFRAKLTPAFTASDLHDISTLLSTMTSPPPHISELRASGHVPDPVCVSCSTCFGHKMNYCPEHNWHTHPPSPLFTDKLYP